MRYRTYPITHAKRLHTASTRSSKSGDELLVRSLAAPFLRTREYVGNQLGVIANMLRRKDPELIALS